MKAVTFVPFFLILCLITGCVSTEQSTTVGLAGGSVAGAGVGAALGNAGLGALIGAGIGTLGGALAQDHLEKKRQEKEKEALEEQLENSPSTSAGPTQAGKKFVEGHYEYVKKKKWIDTSTTQRVWVEERVEGHKRIEGHYEDRLIPSGYWEEYEEKVWVPDHYE